MLKPGSRRGDGRMDGRLPGQRRPLGGVRSGEPESPANPAGAPAELHGHAVLSHPRLAGEIMDGNGWQISKRPPLLPIPCLSLVGRDNIERTEAEQDTPYMIRGFFNLTAGDSTSLSKG